MLGNFKDGDLAQWKHKIFNNKTVYTIIREPGIGGVLKAQSSQSASGMFREMSVDLNKTPCLHWSWKIDNILNGLDEKTKKGDDYPARVYVVLSGGITIWNTRTISYVWSSNKNNIGHSWPNAFTDKAMIISIQGGEQKKGRWVREVRNVKNDFYQYFDRNINKIDGVALMTDTDNSGQQATSYYGNIYFSKTCQADK
ncbi:MAG: DUF3047 domain-containing protein [Magnetococcales bacterium]|nr:DUF3047 domain-containing protein [Magnetococcales bacterium]